MLGLYIHIPFCRHICSYCDFYKMVASPSYQDTFISYLIKDLSYELSKTKEIDTLYIGGGTPSSLSINNLTILLKTLSSYFDLSKLEEFTIEVNPEDINDELLNLLKKFHVSRLSIGVETLLEAHQIFLGRIFTFQALQERIKKAHDYGFTNINLDLIYALPNETMDELQNDLDKLISLNPTHLSIYSLILEEHTIIKHNYDLHKWETIDEDLESKMYQFIINYLSNHDFIQYETSNFARVGYQSKHNLIYWSNDNYLAAGPSSSSYYNNTRYKRVANMKKYYDFFDNISDILYEEIIPLSEENKMEEEVMLRLRLVEGLNENIFISKFHHTIEEIYPKLNDLIEEGLLIRKDNHIYIPQIYRYIANFIIVKLIEGK